MRGSPLQARRRPPNLRKKTTNPAYKYCSSQSVSQSFSQSFSPVHWESIFWSCMQLEFHSSKNFRESCYCIYLTQKFSEEWFDKTIKRQKNERSKFHEVRHYLLQLMMHNYPHFCYCTVLRHPTWAHGRPYQVTEASVQQLLASLSSAEITNSIMLVRHWLALMREIYINYWG